MRQSAKFNKKKKINIDFGHTKNRTKEKEKCIFSFRYVVSSDYKCNLLLSDANFQIETIGCLE